MPFDFKVAAIQMTSGPDKTANLERAAAWVTQAAEQQAEVVVVPELFNCLGELRTVLANAEPVPGPTTSRFAALARQLNIHLCLGSIAELGPHGKAYNTAVFLGPDGHLLARYRKIHLFQIAWTGRVALVESDIMLPGTEVVTHRARDTQFGFATCYDLRFPELFRALASQDVDLICFPSAFTKPTGEVHWHTLVRARAIENQCYVVAANQVGQHAPALVSYGHSMIVDAWGNVLAEADGEQEQLITARVTSEHLVKVRTALPALQHRRLSGS